MMLQKTVTINAIVFDPNDKDFSEKLKREIGANSASIMPIENLAWRVMVMAKGKGFADMLVDIGDYICATENNIFTMSKSQAKKEGYVQVQELRVEEGDGC